NIPKSVWWLVIGMALNITGSSFLWPLNTIYMKQELGKSLTVAGLVLMINSFGMVIGNLLGGSLFDKLGGYKTILIGTFT
ncbi:MFS transporter, partial [Staphylococcus pseudintermedius]